MFKNTKVLIGSLVVVSFILFCVLLGFENHYRGKAKDVWQEKAKQEEKSNSEEDEFENESDNYFKDYTQGDVSL